MGQFDDIFGVKTPDDSGVAVSGEYDDIFGIKPQRTLKTNLQDVAATAAKGITGLSDAAIGLANIPTRGQAGRSAQLVGLNEVYGDPMQAEQALQEHQQNIAAGKRNEFLDASPYSAPQQFAQKQVTDAEGVLGKLGAAVRNPSTIATAVGESVPSMLAGGMIGRGLAVGTKLSPVVGGAIGEGVVGAGAAAEQTRKESPTGTLTPQQTAMAVGSGIGTGIFGYVGGKVANKLGFDDADTLIANGFQRVAKKSAAGGAEVAEKGFAQNAAEVAGRIVGGGISEGAFEELPQSIQETMWQNAATGKPLTEGMDEAAVMGFLSGVAMGGPVNALPRPNTQDSPEQPQAEPLSPDQAPFPTQEPPPPYTESVPGPETLQPPAPPVPAPGPISRAADMLARTTPGIMGKVMDPALAPLPEDNLAGEWNAQKQQALAGNQARNFTQAEQAAYDLEQQRQAQQAEARRRADPLAAQKAAFEESYNAMGTVPESLGNITPDEAAAFERKVEFERATNRRQQYIKAWKQAEQEADTLTRDPEIPAAVKREARKQVREIVKADPVYEQMNEVKRRGGLNLEAMGQDYDRDTVNIINRRYPGIFSRVGSVKPDDFANEMGYDDLDAMVRRFSEARTQKELTASILKEKTGAWQNAESAQQAYAAKQAERKQGAEWAGAQGADRVSRGIPARTVFPAPDEAVSAMESMIRRKPENFKEEDFDHWTYTAEQQGRLKQAYREAVNGRAGKQDQNSEAASGDRLYQNDLLERNGGVQDGVGQTAGGQQSTSGIDREGPTGAEENVTGRGAGSVQPELAQAIDGQEDGRGKPGEGRLRNARVASVPRVEPRAGGNDALNASRDQRGGSREDARRSNSRDQSKTPLAGWDIQEGQNGPKTGVVIQDEVVATEPIRRQPGESTRDFIKRRKAGNDRRVSRNTNDDDPQADLSSTDETQTLTDSLTNRIANVADQQSSQDVIVDKTIDKRADKSAAEKGEDSEFAGNKVFTADKVEAARARLKAKRGSLSSGFDPELMQDMLIIGGAHFESGIRKFSAWSKAVMADIGEEFKPFLRGTYENLRHYPGIEKEGMSTAAEIEGIDLDAIGKQADNAGKEQSQPAAETNKEATDVQANSQSVPEAAQSGRTEPATNRGEGSGVSADAGEGLPGPGRPDRQADDGKPARRSDRTGKGAQHGADDSQGGVDERHGGILEQPVASSSSPQNYRITEADRLGKGGAKQKARDNIKAISILKQLRQESRPATADEQAQLVKYVGWGASELANGVFSQKKYEPASRRYVDSYKEDWKSIGEDLRAALTDEEYNAAKASTINAHYTSEKIIKGMYAALERFGYTGKGKALEPGSGVGHFIGLLPDAFTAGTRFTTVEMDPISAGIAKALYPGHDVRQADFTKFKAPDNFFDIAIGNPPFADIEIVSDHDYAEKKFKLHDYFFAKSIDKVRPGGLMVLVTSRYTMDKGNDKARSYLAKRADLLGAIRLPQTAFKENAGTEVVTDVLFLRKRLEGERPAGQAWGRLEPVQAGDKKIHVNEYFASHPEMVLGKHSTAGSMYGPGQYTVDPNKGDIAEQFAQAVANLPENVYQADKSSPAPTDNQTIEAEWSPQSVKEGAFYLDDKGELRQKENGMGAPVVGMGKKKAVVKDFVRIRDAVRQVLYVQLKDEGDLAAAQQELGDAYDAFVAAHGPINKTTEVASTNKTTGKESVSYRYPNFSHFKADPDAYLVAAIEKYDDATHKAEKTDIFTKRVISPPAEPRVESLVDALHVSLHQAGEVDVPLIAKMMGVDEDTAIEGLSGAIYLDPNGNRWVTADEYLSGNVRRKLSAARAAADIEPKYKANVAALEAVQPQDLPPSRIKVSLGMPIIQAEEVESFAAEVMQMGISVRHIAATGTWAVAKRSGYQTLVATNDYGTNRLDAADLIDAALNNRTVKVYDRDSDGKQIFNRDETEAAFAKLQKIRERFSQWAWEDAGRSTLLARKFNDLYNNTVKREYGGDHIKQMRFPGMSAVITPHEHQKRVAWRIVQRGNTYMAHSVGAGKTIGSIIAGMELKRLGIKKKPMWVVPNHMLKQFSSEFQQLYPAAKLLVADEEQFAKGNRNRFMGRIAAENWDGIIITHSAFGKIPVSEEYQSEFIGEQIAELEDMMVDADGDRTKTKQLERQKKRLEQRLERILNNASKDKGVSFEESGIDQLFVDEAHQFRKLDFVTNQTSISGIDPNGSLMAFDLYVKTRYLETMYPGRSMVMMSGTPVTNTIGEVYTIQRFLSEPALRELDIHNFDAWAATFGESVTELVATPAGTYQPKTRFGRFRNMPSLAGMWGEIGDFVHAKDLPYLKRPMVDGGGRKMIIGQSSDIQKAYKQSLAARIKAIKERKGPPQKGDDILLTVITDGRHAALDERFIAPEAKARKDAKLEMLVDKVHGIWDESAEKRSTQMIFADLGLPQAEATRGFSVYKHIKQELMRRGVPEAEIAFMQDYKKSDEKQKLFKAMNNGDVRVLIGSSAAMGTGVNAQRKLVALHHFDPDTYLPSNIEQREGRIVRQGNENEQVQLYVYLTRGSYDETMWQFIESKQRFIDQFLAGSVTEDTVEDIDGAANQYAEARAMSSDNPLVLELAGLENDISKLESLRRAHVDGQVRMARDRSAWKSRIGTIEKLIPMVEAAAKARVDTKGERFAMTVSGKNYKVRADAGEKLIGLLKSQAARPVMVEAHDIGEIAGFTLKARSNTLDPRDMVFTLWHGKTELQGKVEERYNKIAIENGLEKEPSPSGLVMRLENLARGVDERLEGLKDELAKAEHVIKEADNRMGAKFEQIDALEDKRARADEIRAQLEREGSDNQESTGPGEQEVKLSKSTSSNTPSSTPSDIRAEIAAKLGKFRTMQLMRRGVLNVVATQEEAEADIQNKEDAFRSEQTGAIQGYVKKGKLHLVADGITSGNAYQVFLHEISHLTRLGLNSNASFKRLLDTIERHKGQDTALGEAIDAAEARIPADTKPEHRTEEILAYLIENDRTDVGVVRRFIAMVKKVLVNMGVSPDIFSKEDFKALAVNAAKWQSTMATGGNVMRSVREMFKPVDPNSPSLKRWQGNSQLTEPVFHGSPKEFWTFDKNRVGKNTTSPGAGLGFFFATNRAESQGYAGPSGSLRSFYVKAENPKYMNASDLPKFRGVDEAQAYAKRQQLAGYDSIILEDEGHVIVFEPNQVKSAEINTGEFDAGNDDVRYSVAANESGPMSLENLEDVATDMSEAAKRGSIKFLKSPKKDSTFWERLFSTPEYYFKKKNASGQPGSSARVLQAALLRRDVRFEKQSQILGDFVTLIQALRKENKAAYEEANDYLVGIDQGGTGFKISQTEDGWAVIGPDRKKRGVYEEEAGAISEMIKMEGMALRELGFSDQSIEAVKMARELTNRGFDVMAEDMRRIIAEAKDNGLPDPYVSDAKIDEAGRYGIYAEGRKTPIALFASEQEAKERLAVVSELVSYAVVSRSGKMRNFNSLMKAKAWVAKRGGRVDKAKRFANLSIRKRTDKEMRPMTVREALAQMGDLRGTYFPRIRESGEYVLKARKDGENPFRQSFDLLGVGDGNLLQGVLNSITPIGRKAKELKAKGYDVTIERDTNPTDDVFDATKLITSLDAILQDSMGLVDKNDSDEVKASQHIDQILTMQIADIFKARGYLASRMQRLSGEEVWEGYETDMGKALTQYGKNIGAGTAKRDTARQMVLAFTGRDYTWKQYKEEVEDPKWDEYKAIVEERRIDPGKEKNLFKDVRGFMVDVLRNDEQADRIIGTMKGLAVHKFLGFRLSSAAVNATNMVTGVVGTMSGHTGESITRSMRRVTAAAIAYGKYRSGMGEISEADRNLFQEITRRGWDEAQFDQEAMSELRSKAGELWNKYATWSMFMFGAIEKANRAMTLFAAYKGVAAKNPKMEAEDVWDAAKEISDRAHGVYGKETMPAIARGGELNRALRLPLTFTKFTHNYMLNILDLGFSKKEYKAAAYLLLSPALMAGAGATVAAPMVFALAGALGIGGDDPEEEFYDWMADTFGSDAFARHGLAGLAGINIKGSLQVNLPMPADIAKINAASLAGPVGGIVSDTFKGVSSLAKGDISKGVEVLLPTAFGSMLKAARESSEGITTSNYGSVFYGDEPLKADTVDAVLRFFSFNPSRISGIREKQWNEKEASAKYQEKRTKINNAIKRDYLQGKPALTPERMKEIKQYNDLVRGSGRSDISPLTVSSIRTMLKRASRPGKTERIRAADNR